MSQNTFVITALLITALLLGDPGQTTSNRFDSSITWVGPVPVMMGPGQGLNDIIAWRREM